MGERLQTRRQRRAEDRRAESPMNGARGAGFSHAMEGRDACSAASPCHAEAHIIVALRGPEPEANGGPRIPCNHAEGAATHDAVLSICDISVVVFSVRAGAPNGPV